MNKTVKLPSLEDLFKGSPKSTDTIANLAKNLSGEQTKLQEQIKPLVAESSKGYSYDEDFYYISEIEYQADPFNEAKTYLIAANSTPIKPPELKKNQCAKYDLNLRKWQILPDFKGVKYWLDGKELIFTKKGEPLPEKAQLKKPAPTPEQALQIAINALEQINSAVINKAKLELSYSENLVALAENYNSLNSELKAEAKKVFLKIAKNAQETEAQIIARILEHKQKLLVKKSELDALKIANSAKIKADISKAHLIILEHAKQLTPIYSNTKK